MSACIFIASDHPLNEFAPEKRYPLSINIDSGVIDDGGADDNYFLTNFPDVSVYCSKKHGVSLEWNYTEGRAREIIKYIQKALDESDTIELWRVYLIGYWEFEDRPIIHKRTISINDLTVEGVKAIEEANLWAKEDKNYPERPSFYCLTVMK